MFSIIVAASATKLQVKRLPGFSVFVVKTLIHTKKENYFSQHVILRSCIPYVAQLPIIVL